MDIFDLSAKLTLDTSEYQNGIEGASKSASSFGDVVTGTLKTALEVGVVAFTAFTTAVAGVVTTMADAISDTAAYGDSIDKNSQKVGMSAKSYQEWDYVMQLAGTSMQDCTVGMKTLTNQIDNAKTGSADALAMFDSLGISLDDLNTMSREDVFSNVIAGLQGMEDSTERAALANDLFGKSGQNLTPLFNMSQQETKELIDKFNELGGVMSDDAVKASARYQDSLTTLQVSIDSTKRGIASEFLPAMADVMDGLTDIFSGDSSGGIQKIRQGVESMVAEVQELLPQITQIMSELAPVIGEAISIALPAIIESASQILLAIGQGILQNFPTIVETAKDVLKQLGDSFIENLPMIIDTGVDILLSLIDGFVEALPQLIDAVLLIIEKLTDKLTEPDTLNKLVDAAIKLTMALQDGLIKATPVLLEAIVQIIVALIAQIVMHFPEMVETGFRWLGMLWEGISNFIAPFTENFSKFLADIIVKITDKFEEFKKNGTEILKKMWDGIKSWVNTLKTNVSNTVKNVLDWFKEIPNKIKDVGKNIIEGLWNGINDKVNWIKEKSKAFQMLFCQQSKTSLEYILHQEYLLKLVDLWQKVLLLDGMMSSKM